MHDHAGPAGSAGGRARAPRRPSPRAVATATLLLAAAVPATVRAQIADVTRSSVTEVRRLTFGHLCADTFVLRNDSDRSVDAALAVEGAGERTPVQLGGHEQVEFTSKSRADVELWVDDKLVAKAEKERRKCDAVQRNASVAVAPLNAERDDANDRRAWANYPFYDPWFYGPYWRVGFYGAYAWPAYYGYVGVPIVIGGGFRGGAPPRRR